MLISRYRCISAYIPKKNRRGGGDFYTFGSLTVTFSPFNVSQMHFQSNLREFLNSAPVPKLFKGVAKRLLETI